MRGRVPVPYHIRRAASIRSLAEHLALTIRAHYAEGTMHRDAASAFAEAVWTEAEAIHDTFALCSQRCAADGEGDK